MKSFLLTLISVICSVSAAAVFNCANQITPLRSEFAHLETFPKLQLTTSFEECPEGGGSCGAGVLDEIATETSVCFKPVVLNRDCDILESDIPGYPKLEVNCHDGANVLIFDTDAAYHGTAACYDNATVVKTWDLGRCLRE